MDDVISERIRKETLDVLRDVLENPDLREEDDFFESGGDSLLVARSIALLKERNLRVRARAFTNDPRIESIIAEVSTMDGSWIVDGKTLERLRA
ncbi:phosphopantetheine-binding protein [Nocardiopsis sp. NPDC006938]|uniref:acyl carrier protein n=1 Tax=Nocardiopsis sp. NPDC006938 TaxID=3364337 RepID=UPI0036BC16F5